MRSRLVSGRLCLQSWIGGNCKSDDDSALAYGGETRTRLELSVPKSTARFRVDPKLATLLGEAYRSSEYALKELVDNAWDADATEVRITLPAPMTGGDIVIADTGTGMMTAEVRGDYLVIARDRRTRRGDRTAGRNRPVKGRKGIGKFAGLMAADTMVLETRCRGTATRLQISTESLLPGNADLEAIDLPVTSEPCPPDAHGTTITLSGLHQGFDVPTPERLKPILMLEYGRQADFALYVNDELVGVEDIPGQSFAEETDVPGVGPVRLVFTVSDGHRALPQSGVAVRVTGKVIGKPTHFGLEDDDEIPPKLLKKVYGELEADGLAADVTAD
jgi:Histidine kinase-, DNA gyrase B-, and HSP90-like ATPase